MSSRPHSIEPLFLKGPYFSEGPEHRPTSDDVRQARLSFERRRLPNLDVLLEQRFVWMERYLRPDSCVVEFGAGAGLAQMYLNYPGLLLSDVEPRPWLDLVADALVPPFRPKSLDAVVCNQVLHHIATPARFLEAAAEVIKPGGYLLINEPETSLLLRAILRVMQHEGWSYDVDPFDAEAVCVDGADPWSGNAAIAQVLFADPAKFEAHFPAFRVVENSLCECLVFLLSGGVSSKTFTVPMPRSVVMLLKHIDDGLVGILPGVFALGRRIALQRL